MDAPYRILIVDDDPSHVRLIARSLQKAGHETLEADDGMKGVRVATEQQPDLILLGVMMPGRGGFEVCRILKSQEATASIPVIFLTAASQTDELLNAFSVGGCDCVIKPCTTPELLARISVHVRLRRAEQNLRRAHAETRQLLESIPSILISLDEDDRITAWNSAAERTFEVAARDVIGRPFNDCGVRCDTAAVAGSISECRTKNQPTQRSEVRFKRPDGQDGFLGLSVSPVATNGNGLGRVLLVGADITEHKILQSQLAQAQKLEAIGQLAAGIAHEINTPTQFVGDNIRFLHDAFEDVRTLLAKYAQLWEASRDGAPSSDLVSEVDAAAKEADIEYLSDEIPKAIEQSLEGVERVTKIVRSMKEFSHPGGKEKQGIDLNKAIESTITVARNEWKYVAEMVTDFDTSLPLVPCLVGDFNQVILNMIINAAQAITDVVGDNTGKKGTITVATRQKGDCAEIRVSDTGSGIPAEIRSKVFDPFFTTKPVGTGTGQGLAIAHTVVVKKHGGRISVQSEAGQGTTFTIRLPIEPKPDEQAGTECYEEAHSLR